MSNRAEQTHRAILDAAWSLLSDRATHAVRLQDIADRAGVSRQSIYVHFGSRAGLMLELVEHVDRSLDLGRRFAPVWEEDDPARALELALRTTARYAPAISDVSAVLDRLRHEDEAIQGAWEDRMAQRRRGLRKLVRRLDAEHRLVEGWSVDEVVDALWTASEPRSYVDLVEDRGWTVGRYEEWLAFLARSVVADRR